jgi:hypothetical protein
MSLSFSVNFSFNAKLRNVLNILSAAEITPGFSAAAAAQALVVRGGPDLCPRVTLALPFQSPSWHGAMSIVDTLLERI